MHRIALALALLAAPALAADPPRTPSPAQLAQQEKMRSCNATAAERNLHGEARSAFMKECLSGATTGTTTGATTGATTAAPAR